MATDRSADGRLNIRMDPDLREALKEDAKENKRTLAAHASYLLEERARQWRKNHPKPVPELRGYTPADRRQAQEAAWQETLRSAVEQLQERR